MCWCAYRYMALGIALRYVLEALKKAPGTNMYKFGLTALDKFKTRFDIISFESSEHVYVCFHVFCVVKV